MYNLNGGNNNVGAIVNQSEIVGATVNGKIIYEAPSVMLLSSLIFGADSGQKDINTKCGLYNSDGTIIDVLDAKQRIIFKTSGYVGKKLSINKIWNALLNNHLTDFYLSWDSHFLNVTDYDTNGNFVKSHNAYIHHDTLTEQQIEAGANNLGFFNSNGASFLSGNNGIYSSPQAGKLLYNVESASHINVSAGENIIDAFNNNKE